MTRILALACTLGFAIESLAAPTSENNERLREGLKQFPEADTDKDGILTIQEAQAFLAKMKSRPGKTPKSAAKPKGTPPDFANVAYGPHERNVLDFWKAKADKPGPVVVFIHGGGFRAGSKENWQGDPKLEELLKAGVSCAAVNYRYLWDAPVQDIMRDCARSLQFIRSKAAEWHVDKTRFAAVGGSAGAGTSLWLDARDDLANPKASDPVLRESSRVCCAALLSTQATYDVMRWESFLGPPQPGFFVEDEVPLFYGLPDIGALKSPAGESIRRDCDMLAWINAGDGPIFMDSKQDVPKPTTRGEWLHCTAHARTVKKQCQSAGVDCVLVQDDKTAPPITTFLLSHLGVKAAEAAH